VDRMPAAATALPMKLRRVVILRVSSLCSLLLDRVS